LEAAAVAGEPFEPELVADIAGVGEDVVLAALDALLEVALVRPTATPRSFDFRHPLVRHTVYAAAPGAWRLQAHARASDALGRRGAAPPERAHHVEHAAQRGDLAAVELLADAARAVFGQAPATAAGYLRSALRLSPHDAHLAPRRAELLQLLTEALLGAGELEAAHQAIGEALHLLPPQAWEPRGQLISLQASIESWSGHPSEQSLRRLRAALAEMPPDPSFATFALRMPLAGIELLDLQLERVPAIAMEAVGDARRLGLSLVESAALSMLALGHAAAGRPDDAHAPLDRALALVADVDDAAIGRHPQGFWTAGWALTYLDRYDEAISQLARGVTIGHRTGHGYFLPVLLAYQRQPLIQLGRLTEAIGARRGSRRRRLDFRQPAAAARRAPRAGTRAPSVRRPQQRRARGARSRSPRRLRSAPVESQSGLDARHDRRRSRPAGRDRHDVASRRRPRPTRGRARRATARVGSARRRRAATR
jgi:tetratricopeptide (TPR) repeat protein